MYSTNAARRPLTTLSRNVIRKSPSTPKTPFLVNRKIIDRRYFDSYRSFSASPQSFIQTRIWRPRNVKFSLLAFLLTSLVLGLAIAAPLRSLEAEAPPAADDESDSKQGNEGEGEGLKEYRLSEVKEHGPKSERPWVIRGDKVYDITDWIAGHPGGEVILRAAGGSVEPYWKIFNIHQKREVYDILETYLIGTISPLDLISGSVPLDSIEDPFINDPPRSPKLHQHTTRPCNAETPASHLSSFITPNHVFYVRNHMWVPSPPPSGDLIIELNDGEEFTVSMEDLKTRFKQHTITSTLQCSGNRRSHMTSACTHTSGLQWKAGAIGTATWTGPFLRDVLASTGFPISDPPREAQHVQFTGHEAYGASIPISKALSPSGDVLLAHTMNSAPIPPDHGYPLRVIVPGNVAARSVKWLSRISVSDEESTSQWQRRDYKSFGPNERGLEDWSKAKSIQEMPVNSAVTSIVPKEDGFVVRGWAYSGGGREVVRVDVSTNDGKTWDQADLVDESDSPTLPATSQNTDHSQLPQSNNAKHWAWKQWTYTIPSYTISDAKKPITNSPNDSPLTKDHSENKDASEKKKKAKMILVAKATDEAYNTQPENFEPIYNVRGNLAVAWHRVPLRVERLEKKGTSEVEKGVER